VCDVCVTGGPLACVSNDDGVGVNAMGPCVSEGKGERVETDEYIRTQQVPTIG
jgi:hypothetical protein